MECCATHRARSFGLRVIKGDRNMQHKRRALTLIVVVGIILFIGVLMMAGPSLMNAIIALHSH
jgi:hypothetical protein